MRFVIFDDETTEPVTVVNLAGIAERDIWDRMDGKITLCIPGAPSSILTDEMRPPSHRPYLVDLRFERFVRNGHVTLMCFTKQSELAMLLEPDFLPGQRREVADLRDRSEKLQDLLLQALAARL
jgi:hypothetical protein